MKTTKLNFINFTYNYNNKEALLDFSIRLDHSGNKLFNEKSNDN
jgi:hypothetical protein